LEVRSACRRARLAALSLTDASRERARVSVECWRGARARRPRREPHQRPAVFGISSLIGLPGVSSSSSCRRALHPLGRAAFGQTRSSTRSSWRIRRACRLRRRRSQRPPARAVPDPRPAGSISRVRSPSARATFRSASSPRAVDRDRPRRATGRGSAVRQRAAERPFPPDEPPSCSIRATGRRIAQPRQLIERSVVGPSACRAGRARRPPGARASLASSRRALITSSATRPRAGPEAARAENSLAAELRRSRAAPTPPRQAAVLRTSSLSKPSSTQVPGAQSAPRRARERRKRIARAGPPAAAHARRTVPRR